MTAVEVVAILIKTTHFQTVLKIKFMLYLHLEIWNKGNVKMKTIKIKSPTTGPTAAGTVVGLAGILDKLNNWLS